MSRRAVIAWVSTIAVVGAVVAIGLVWPGLDAKRTPPVDTSVWALQTGAGSRYARVNTAVGELDTVRGVSNPTAVADSATGSFLFSERFGRVTEIDDALPVDLDEATLKESPSTPAGTVSAAVGGGYVAYHTDSGAVFVGALGADDVTQLDPFGAGEPEDDTPEYTAEAITVSDDGTLYAYSAADRAVLRYRIPTGEVAGRDTVAAGPAADDDIGITAAGEDWFLVALSDGRAWRRGGDEPVIAELTGAAVVSRPTSGDAVYLADQAGLVRIPADGGAPTRVVGGADRDYGTPARPVEFRGEVHAGWVGSDGGVLWHSGPGGGEIALDFAGQTLGDVRRPVLTDNGSVLILNETRSGWVWTAPDGALIASSQDWSLDDHTDPDTRPSDEQASFVLDPKPPVAEPDVFGVRAGGLVSLAPLLNDHDPNTDVLSIDPESVTGLDPSFGSVSITDNAQRLAVRVDAAADGTATFHYRVTDGTSDDGLYSEVTTVTLQVAGNGNSAPEFCGVEGCLATWPEPQVAPGGTASIPVLNGWVDPEGDPLLLLSVDNPSGVGAVAATPSGDLVYQHPDASRSDAQLVELAVTVADVRGAQTTRSLVIHIDPSPTLVATSFAVEESLTAGAMTVDVASHVSGAAGRLTVSAVRVLDDAPAQAVPSSSGTSFDFTATAAGTYRVSYTVTAGGEPATGLARITMLPADAVADLATPPVIAFVRPKEDATIDVLDAVSNPTRRVLLLSDVRPVAEAGASMTVDAVGQHYIRVAGSTATGEPGRLGTVRYIVSDGTEDAGSRIEGEATVYLLPSPPELAPIAVDDSVVVRAGAQIDIPVLANDVAPSGGAVTLNPASVSADADGGLAFASGGVLRYLAPSEPGEHHLTYAIYASGAPQLTDTAVVRVTVIDDDSNRAPRPETLQGRVLSGQSTTIEFERFGADPDGDQVELDRIVTQPEAGSATISADGTAIVYASAPGDSGQRSFQYAVTDSAGETGIGTVRVGVLDDEANPSPVTFTDYVQVQAGARNSIRVSPLANDVDPTGGVLSLTDVRPDVAPTRADGSDSPEYVRQEGLLRAEDAGMVVIDAGTTPSTMSFLYDVRSDSGNTARGLIVVKVVREEVPDFPVVTDTQLTAENRERFRSGVDVVTDMVSWSGGDVDDLSLSLWGEPAGIQVDGWRISGSLPERTRVIPFALTGTATSGEEVTTYGFLRVPGDDDVTLALREGVTAQEVTERDAVTFDMHDLVAVPAGARLEVGADIRSAGARADASCRGADGSLVRYDAGGGAPWADACIVPVRVAGQTGWTYLSVRVRVVALEPQPLLHAASLTVGPGETVTFDLREGMTTWQFREDWSGIRYSVEHAGSVFDVSATPEGVVTVTGSDTALPGTDDVATVQVTSHTGVPSARLILRVGAAPSTLPQGGTVSERCSQASGSSCTIDVVGVAGEVNPLPGTPMELIDVRAAGSCEGVTFERASATAVRASWTDDAPGATCTATFSLRDAQNRITAGERDGRVVLDLHGFPQGPAALVQSAYDDESVTLRVDPGAAQQAYPGLTGFVVRSAGEVIVQCAADGTCPAFTAPNGEKREYEARAVNDVGESDAAATTVAWAYDPPPPPSSVTAEPVVTGGEGKRVALTVSGLSTTEVGYIEVTSATGETVQVQTNGRAEVTLPSYNVGSNAMTEITVTPFSRFTLPPGFDGATSGSAVVVRSHGVGAPVAPTLSLAATSDGGGTSTVVATGTAAPGGDGSEVRYGFAPADDRCRTEPTGDSATFPGLADGTEYTFQLCVESWYRGRMFGRTTTTETVRAVQSTAAPTGFTFVVDGQPEIGTGTAKWIVRDAPTSATAAPPRFNDPVFENGPPSSVFGRDPGILVRWKHREWGTVSQSAPVRPAAGSAPYQVAATWGLAACTGGSDLKLTHDSSGDGAAISFQRASLTYYDADGAVLSHEDSWLVPVGAVRVEGIGVTVDWSARNWGLEPATARFNGTCSPNLPPEEGEAG